MKKITLLSLILSFPVIAQSSVVEGVVQQADVITTEAGSDGKPILGAAIGVGIGSLIGDGSGRDAAMVAGGLIGAKRQARKKKQIVYGWRYVVKVGEQLQVVDAWCPQPNAQCTGVDKGKEVYVINGKEISIKQ
jgi:hypothetical protein